MMRSITKKFGRANPITEPHARPQKPKPSNQENRRALRARKLWTHALTATAVRFTCPNYRDLRNYARHNDIVWACKSDHGVAR